jgi:phosphotriesterase-related protein
VSGRLADRRRDQALIDWGYGDRVLLSQDVFLKMMLTRHGGFGYAYLLHHFLPRLERAGVSEAAIAAMLVTNPRRVFSSRWRDA